jgi:hypothetical protein
MYIKKNYLIFIFSLYYTVHAAPALTKAQTLNQVKKIMPISKKPIPSKPAPKNTPPIKPPAPQKITVITNLNDLNKAIEKFHADQKKLRATNRSHPWNQFVNIQEKCPCTGPSCICLELPKLLTI